MGEDLIYKSALRLWDDVDFQNHYELLKVQNVKSNLRSIIQSDTHIDFYNLFRAASLFSLVSHKNNNCDQFHEASFKIAYMSAKVWKDCPPEIQSISVIILSRLGNFPTIKKQIANDNLVKFILEILKKLPHTFALEVMARYDGNVINLGNIIKPDHLEVTDFQKLLWEGLSRSNDVVSFSSPTSSGKTFILQQFLIDACSRRESHFTSIYVVPTRALISEISFSLRDLLKKAEIEDVEILSISDEGADVLPNKVIYVFTQERLLAFLANVGKTKIQFIDYVIVDEAHQISEKARGALLHQALNWLKYDFDVGKFIFCSPVISNPEIFGNLLVGGGIKLAENYITQVSPVAQNLLIVEPIKGRTDVLEVALHDSSGQRLRVYDQLKLENKRLKNSKAHFLAYCAFNLGEGKRNIIYVDSPSDADDVAKELISLIGKSKDDPDLNELSEYICSVIHEDFILASALKYGIGIHYGKMPSLVRDVVERLFRDETLNFIICTSTLAQGVNLPAQNLFILDPRVKDVDTKAYDSISRAAFWNIVGRAGRLYRDFEGNVFLLKQPLSEQNWEDTYLNTDKLSRIVPTAETVILNQRPALIEHLIDPYKDAQKGIEEVASLIYDMTSSKRDINKELSWIKDMPRDALAEIKAKTDSAEREITLSASVIKKNVGISPIRQQVLYDFLLRQTDLRAWLLPMNLSSVNKFHTISCEIIKVLDSPSYDPETLKRYTWTFIIPALDWMKGKPLNLMIISHLNFLKRSKSGPLSSKQVNSGIRDLFEKIETHVRFKLVKYINCYNNICMEACLKRGQMDLVDEIPMHLPLFLEVGASNSTQVALISLGLSRITALEVSKNIPNVKYESPKDLVNQLDKLIKRTNKLPKACTEEIMRYLVY